MPYKEKDFDFGAAKAAHNIQEDKREQKALDKEGTAHRKAQEKQDKKIEDGLLSVDEKITLLGETPTPEEVIAEKKEKTEIVSKKPEDEDRPELVSTPEPRTRKEFDREVEMVERDQKMAVDKTEEYRKLRDQMIDEWAKREKEQPVKPLTRGQLDDPAFPQIEDVEFKFPVKGSWRP